MNKLFMRLMAICLALTLPYGAASAETADRQDAFEQIPAELLKGKQIGYTITAKPMIIENERFAVNIPADVYVPDTLEDDINIVMDTIEQQTGLLFYSDYAKKNGHAKIQLDIQKLENGEFGNTYGGAYGVNLSPGDLIFKYAMDIAVTHELLHTIHWRNTAWGSQALYEAFATYETQRIVEAQIYPMSFDSYSNYCDTDFDGIAKNKSVKAQFEISDEDGWQAYLLGFRLMHYIAENYGLEEFYALGREEKEGYISNMEAYELLLNRYGEEFFTGYAAWLEQNIDRFNGYDSQVDFTNFKRLDVFPFKGSYNLYNLAPFTYRDYIVFDFLSGFDYAKNYLGAELKDRICGNVCSAGGSQMRFYDDDGNVLETIQLEPDTFTAFSVEGASVVAFAGDGGLIRFYPEIDSMMTIP